jgi:L-lactate dehydrogenase (cytochrome)
MLERLNGFLERVEKSFVRHRLARAHNIADLQRMARWQVPKPMFEYLEGGADDEVSLRRNLSGFDTWDIVPRQLRDVSNVDTSTTVMNQKLDWPVFLAPTGSSRLFHHQGEIAVARAASRAGTAYSLSTLSSVSVEDIGNVSDGPKCFQLYPLRDRSFTRDCIQRARDAGFKMMCLTVDVAVGGNRERDLRSGMTVPPKLSLPSLLDFTLRPWWVYHHFMSPRFSLANIEGRVPIRAEDVHSILQYIVGQFDRSLDWDDAQRIVEEWGGPFAIKGILSPGDAAKARDIGATAVMVSNHGGRQLDSTPAPIDVLSDIVQSVGGDIEVILDGGIRRGTDVIKALALGAKACMIGRPYLYGLAAGGESGVDRALELLRSEVERNMALTGMRSVAEIDSSILRRVET